MSTKRPAKKVSTKKVPHKTKLTKSKAESKKKTKQKQSIIKRAKQRINDFMSRRPHRSFRLTRRRDYVRSLDIPGYWAFTASVVRVMRKNWRSLLLICLIYVVISLLMFGLSSQENLGELRDTISGTGEEIADGNWSALSQAFVLALTTVSGSVSPTLTESQQIYSVLLGLIIWLSTVWLLRHRLAGNQVKVRDALYNSGAPIISTAILFVVLLIQMLPIALAVIGYAAATTSGLLSGGGVEAMLFWLAATALAVLSLYWAASTALALVVVTLPGMYPLRALSVAGDMVSGRRLKILFRLAWLGLMLVVVWAVILIPLILLNTWLVNTWPAVEVVPMIPLVVLVMSTSSLIVVTTYVYLLYRKIVADESKPA